MSSVLDRDRNGFGVIDAVGERTSASIVLLRSMLDTPVIWRVGCLPEEASEGGSDFRISAWWLGTSSPMVRIRETARRRVLVGRTGQRDLDGETRDSSVGTSQGKENRGGIDRLVTREESPQEINRSSWLSTQF